MKNKKRTSETRDAYDYFYCDVGMKAVLRSIRNYLINQLGLSLNKNRHVTSQMFRKASINFFREQVFCGSEDKDFVIRNKEAIFMVMKVFLDLADISGSTIRLNSNEPAGSCAQKRMAKARKVNFDEAVSLSDEDKYSGDERLQGRKHSTFTNFNKDILLPLQMNPMYDSFRDYLIRKKTKLLTKFQKTATACRAQSFNELLFWI